MDSFPVLPPPQSALISSQKYLQNDHDLLLYYMYRLSLEQVLDTSETASGAKPSAVHQSGKVAICFYV